MDELRFLIALVFTFGITVSGAIGQAMWRLTGKEMEDSNYRPAVKSLTSLTLIVNTILLYMVIGRW